MKPILVTGGAGFIGSHLVEHLLSQGEGVHVIDNFDDFYDPAIKRQNVRGFQGRVSITEADLRDYGALERVFQEHKPKVVVHLAARAGVRPSIAQPGLYTAVNVVGTQNLLELARLNGVRKFIFASSSSVYGVNQKVPFSESDPVSQPISPYAATKLAGEHLCHVYHHLYGMEIICLRFFTVYGPRQRPDLAIHKFTRAISQGQPIPVFGNGSSRRDYTYIDDIVQGVIGSLNASLSFEVINLGESRTVALQELVELLENTIGKKAVIQRQPTQAGDVPITFADTAKAKRLLKYQPKVPIEAGIRFFWEWYRNLRH